MNRTPFHPDHEPTALGTLLRALPDHAPDTGTWQRIRARAVARQRRRRLLRTGLPLALAASLLLALGLGYTLTTHHHASPPESSQMASIKPTVTNNGVTLAQLQGHSMRLEQWLAELRANGAPLQGQALASAVDLQDRIGLIDLQLDAPGNGGDRQALWQQRIRLLQDLAMLRASQSPVSGQPMMAESRSAYSL